MLNIVITYLVFCAAPAIVAKISPAAQQVIAKVMGLLTAVIGVQFIINGGTTVIVDLMRNATP